MPPLLLWAPAVGIRINNASNCPGLALLSPHQSLAMWEGLGICCSPESAGAALFTWVTGRRQGGPLVTGPCGQLEVAEASHTGTCRAGPSVLRLLF